MKQLKENVAKTPTKKSNFYPNPKTLGATSDLVIKSSIVSPKSVLGSKRLSIRKTVPRLSPSQSSITQKTSVKLENDDPSVLNTKFDNLIETIKDPVERDSLSLSNENKTGIIFQMNVSKAIPDGTGSRSSLLRRGPFPKIKKLHHQSPSRPSAFSSNAHPNEIVLPEISNLSKESSKSNKNSPNKRFGSPVILLKDANFKNKDALLKDIKSTNKTIEKNQKLFKLSPNVKDDLTKSNSKKVDVAKAMIYLGTTPKNNNNPPRTEGSLKKIQIKKTSSNRSLKSTTKKQSPIDKISTISPSKLLPKIEEENLVISHHTPSSRSLSPRPKRVSTLSRLTPSEELISKFTRIAQNIKTKNILPAREVKYDLKEGQTERKTISESQRSDVKKSFKNKHSKTPQRDASKSLQKLVSEDISKTPSSKSPSIAKKTSIEKIFLTVPKEASPTEDKSKINNQISSDIKNDKVLSLIKNNNDASSMLKAEVIQVKSKDSLIFKNIPSVSTKKIPTKSEMKLLEDQKSLKFPIKHKHKTIKASIMEDKKSAKVHNKSMKNSKNDKTKSRNKMNISKDKISVPEMDKEISSKSKTSKEILKKLKAYLSRNRGEETHKIEKEQSKSPNKSRTKNSKTKSHKRSFKVSKQISGKREYNFEKSTPKHKRERPKTLKSKHVQKSIRNRLNSHKRKTEPEKFNLIWEPPVATVMADPVLPRKSAKIDNDDEYIRRLKSSSLISKKTIEKSSNESLKLFHKSMTDPTKSLKLVKSTISLDKPSIEDAKNIKVSPEFLLKTKSLIDSFDSKSDEFIRKSLTTINSQTLFTKPLEASEPDKLRVLSVKSNAETVKSSPLQVKSTNLFDIQTPEQLKTTLNDIQMGFDKVPVIPKTFKKPKSFRKSKKSTGKQATKSGMIEKTPKSPKPKSKEVSIKIKAPSMKEVKTSRKSDVVSTLKPNSVQVVSGKLPIKESGKKYSSPTKKSISKASRIKSIVVTKKSDDLMKDAGNETQKSLKKLARESLKSTILPAKIATKSASLKSKSDGNLIESEYESGIESESLIKSKIKSNEFHLLDSGSSKMRSKTLISLKNKSKIESISSLQLKSKTDSNPELFQRVKSSEFSPVSSVKSLPVSNETKSTQIMDKEDYENLAKVQDQIETMKINNPQIFSGEPVKVKMFENNQKSEEKRFSLKKHDSAKDKSSIKIFCPTIKTEIQKFTAISTSKSRRISKDLNITSSLSTASTLFKQKESTVDSNKLKEKSKLSVKETQSIKLGKKSIFEKRKTIREPESPTVYPRLESVLRVKSNQAFAPGQVKTSLTLRENAIDPETTKFDLNIVENEDLEEDKFVKSVITIQKSVIDIPLSPAMIKMALEAQKSKTDPPRITLRVNSMIVTKKSMKERTKSLESVLCVRKSLEEPPIVTVKTETDISKGVIQALLAGTTHETTIEQLPAMEQIKTFKHTITYEPATDKQIAVFAPNLSKTLALQSSRSSRQKYRSVIRSTKDETKILKVKPEVVPKTVPQSSKEVLKNQESSTKNEKDSKIEDKTVKLSDEKIPDNKSLNKSSKSRKFSVRYKSTVSAKERFDKLAKILSLLNDSDSEQKLQISSLKSKSDNFMVKSTKTKAPTIRMASRTRSMIPASLQSKTELKNKEESDNVKPILDTESSKVKALSDGVKSKKFVDPNSQKTPKSAEDLNRSNMIVISKQTTSIRESVPDSFKNKEKLSQSSISLEKIKIEQKDSSKILKQSILTLKSDKNFQIHETKSSESRKQSSKLVPNDSLTKSSPEPKNAQKSEKIRFKSQTQKTEKSKSLDLKLDIVTQKSPEPKFDDSKSDKKNISSEKLSSKVPLTSPKSVKDSLLNIPATKIVTNAPKETQEKNSQNSILVKSTLEGILEMMKDKPKAQASSVEQKSISYLEQLTDSKSTIRVKSIGPSETTLRVNSANSYDSSRITMMKSTKLVPLDCNFSPPLTPVISKDSMIAALKLKSKFIPGEISPKTDSSTENSFKKNDFNDNEDKKSLRVNSEITPQTTKISSHISKVKSGVIAVAGPMEPPLLPKHSLTQETALINAPQKHEILKQEASKPLRKEVILSQESLKESQKVDKKELQKISDSFDQNKSTRKRVIIIGNDDSLSKRKAKLKTEKSKKSLTYWLKETNPLQLLPRTDKKYDILSPSSSLELKSIKSGVHKLEHPDKKLNIDTKYVNSPYCSNKCIKRAKSLSIKCRNSLKFQARNYYSEKNRVIREKDFISYQQKLAVQNEIDRTIQAKMSKILNNSKLKSTSKNLKDKKSPSDDILLTEQIRKEKEIKNAKKFHDSPKKMQSKLTQASQEEMDNMHNHYLRRFMLAYNQFHNNPPIFGIENLDRMAAFLAKFWNQFITEIQRIHDLDPTPNKKCTSRENHEKHLCDIAISLLCEDNKEIVFLVKHQYNQQKAKKRSSKIRNRKSKKT